MNNNIVKELIKKGVNIPNPDSVYISDEINPDRISNDNVTIYAGCKLFGPQSLIMKNVRIGYEGPVTLENTLVGENSTLNSGFFNGAVFLGDNTIGSGAHIRKGTILEEGARVAHTVGLKQTILFPFVTLGSLINFCDCFMAGGTTAKNHSEVGSSYIHFNYTPNQDKATPSMMGNVHQGVMLDSEPIFLGGQGGLVGPVRIAYGCTAAAGAIIRKNETNNDRLLLGGGFREMSLPKNPGVYKNITHIFNNNIHYIAGLVALKFWYRHIRSLFVKDDLNRLLIHGLQDILDTCIDERINRLVQFCENLSHSRKILLSQSTDKKTNPILVHDKAIAMVNPAVTCFHEQMNKAVSKQGEAFIKRVEKKNGRIDKNYLNCIKGLNREEKKSGTQWLLNIEQNMVEKLLI